jgi:hypothetical protein
VCVCVCVCVHVCVCVMAINSAQTCQQLQEVPATAVFQGTHTVFVLQVHEPPHVCALLPYSLSKAFTGFL